LVIPLTTQPSVSALTSAPPFLDGTSYVQLTTKMFGMSIALLREGMTTFASCGAMLAGVMLSVVFE
jgi:hypothetical protein